MITDYTTLQATILAQAVRPELTAEVTQFIQSCEAMIRREVRAVETRTTLMEADRISGGVYDLGGQVQEVRSIIAAANGLTYRLENVGIIGIRQLPADAPVQHYGVSGQTVEIRGVPATDAELELIYAGWPDPLATTATNELLTGHPDLYLYGSLFHLYNFTQDLELAQASLSVYGDARDKVNEQIARLIGGGSVLPAYNFGHVRTARGY
jgi:hypothetical protein